MGLQNNQTNGTKDPTKTERAILLSDDKYIWPY